MKSTNSLFGGLLLGMSLAFGCGAEEEMPTQSVELGCDADCNGPNCMRDGARRITKKCVVEEVDLICLEFEHAFPDVVIEQATIGRYYHVVTGEVRRMGAFSPDNMPLEWADCEDGGDLPFACTCRQ